MIIKQRTRLPASSRNVRATSAYAGGGERSRAASCRHAGTRPLASRVSVLALAIAMSIGPVSAQQIMAIGDVNPQPASGTTDWELWEQSLYVGNGGVGYLGISGGATVRSSFTDVFGSSAGDGFIGFSTGDKGTVEVFGAGSTWQLNGGSLYVGHNGEGTLLINSEGTVIADAMYIASGGEIDDGFEPGTGSGTVIVSGVGSALKIHPARMQHSHLRVGYFGKGELIVEKGGTVSHLPFAEGVIDIGSWPGGDGKITVTDAGSTMTTIGTLIVGNYGPGELTVTNGGAVSNNQGVVGNGPGFEYEGQSFSGGVGTVAVSGEGSRWTSLGSLTVGNGNKGTLVITDGGVVSSNEGNPDKTSYIGAVASENGDYDPGHGLVTVSGSGSRWIAHGGLVVGGYGIGVLAIENEGVVSSKASYIGRYGVSDGEATVSGVDSAWVIDGNLHVGGEGNGVLTIKDGGKVSQAGGKVTLAVQSGSAGTLNIGAGAGEAAAVAGTLEANAIAFGAGNGTLVFNHRGGADGSELIFASSLSGAGSIVHEHGTTTLSGDGSGFAGTTTVEGGTFQIGNGGTSGSLAGDIAVASTGTLVFNRSDDLTYADKVSGAGALTKRGAGTLTLTGNNDYYATYADGGTLTVDDGGTVDNTLSLIGRNGGNAIIVVTGGGSHWTSGTLAVGYTGTGAFLVEDGGTVTSENVIVGGESGSAGTLTLASGGTVSDDSGVILAQTGTSGTLNIGAAAGDAAAAAGVLDTPTLAFGAGTGTLVFNHTGSVGFTPVLQGTGTITHQAGNTRLTADSSGFSGATTVQGGELKIVQALGGDAVIQDSGLLTVGGRLIGSATARGGGELTGGGVIGGDAAIEAGGVLSNESWRTLNIKGDLTLSGDAQVNVALDAPGNTDALFAIL